MLLLLPGNVNQYNRNLLCYAHLIGWLITPRRSLTRSMETVKHFRFAADNECFTLGEDFDFPRYMRFLERIGERRAKCLFVTVPDVVADANATERRWLEYAPAMRAVGLPMAYVAQDGMESLPCVAYDSLFIGGSTEWKLGPTARRLITEAKADGKWIHMGRVNSIIRMWYAFKIGVDSVDGTGWVKKPNIYLRWALRELESMQQQIQLF